MSVYVVCVPDWVASSAKERYCIMHFHPSAVKEYSDRYFKPQGPGAAQLKGKHVLAVLELCRVLAMGKGGDLDSTPTVGLSAAWDVEEVFERL